MQNDPFKPKPKQPKLPSFNFPFSNRPSEELDLLWDKRFKGRCSGCGFLARTSRDGQERIERATLRRRQSGDLWSMDDGTDATPFCALGTADLLSEFRHLLESRPDARTPKTAEEIQKDSFQETQRVIHMDKRNCRDWTRFREMFDPKEHVELRRQDTMNSQAFRLNVISLVVATILGLASLGLAAFSLWQVRPPDIQEVRIVTPLPQSTPDTATSQPTLTE